MSVIRKAGRWVRRVGIVLSTVVESCGCCWLICNTQLLSVMTTQAAMVPEGRSSLEGQLLGMLFAKLSVPPSPDTSNADESDPAILTDSILSMARKYVQSGDLEKAVEQLDRLKGQTAYVMSDWKKKAMDRVATERALKVIKLECALLNKDLVGTAS